jgi:CzcA family heavy metal efflux pump
MMNWIVGWSMKFRLLVLALAGGMMFFGITQLHNAPVDVLPEFMPPRVEVQTEALGLSAEEVETQITVPLEADLLNGVAFLDEIRSKSVPGLSSIELIFEPGTDIMDARQVVAERLTQATALPTGNVYSTPPQMLEPLSTTNRVMMIRLSSQELSPIQMSVLARWNIRPRLLGVPGVANVAMWGFRDRQLQVQVDPEHLRDRGVSLQQVIETSGNALWVSPLTFLEASTPGTGGFFETPNQRIGIRHVSPITTPDDLAQVSLEAAESQTSTTGLRLGDVAEVVEEHQPLIGDSSADPDGDLLLVIEKFPGANTLEVTRGVEAALDTLRPGLSGMDIDPTVFRPATFIETAIDNLGLGVLIGIALLIVALGAFFYNWRSALISLLVIPLSLVAAGVVLYLRGATVNAMVVAGLVLAVVMVIDDAVIGTDTIIRRLRQRRADESDGSTARAILEASLEARSAALYANLIVVVALLPLYFMAGLSGALLPPLVVSFVLAIAASMLVALTVTPALAIVLLPNAPLERTSPVARWLRERYDAASSRLVSRPGPALAAVAAVVLLALAVLPFLGRSTFPSFKETDLLIRWDAAPGTSLTEMNRITARMSQELREIPGVRNVGAHSGRAVMSDQIVNVNAGETWVSVDPAAEYDATAASIQEVVDGYPGLDRAVLSHEDERVQDGLTTADEPLTVRLYGHDSDVLRKKAERVRQELSEVDGVVAPEVELNPEEPSVEIEVDLTDAQRHGVRPGDVRRAAATLLSGIHVGSLFDQQKVFDVVVWGAPETRASLTDVRELLIDTPAGGHVRLEDVADVRVAANLNVIRREAVQRIVDVGANVRGRDFDDVVADVERRLEGINFPLEYHAEVLGDHAEQQAVETRVLSAAIIAAIGVFLLLQAAFGSWRLAALIFLTLPMALIGGVLAAFAGGGVVVMGSFAGFLALFGIAVRHSVGVIRHLQQQPGGPALDLESAVRGTRDQVTPIVASTTATTAALLPILFLGDVAGLEIVHPMAVVVIGGLVTSALFTLFGLPALYARFGSSHEPLVTDSRTVEEAPREAGVPADDVEPAEPVLVTSRDVHPRPDGGVESREPASDGPRHEFFDEAFDKIIAEARALTQTLRRQAEGEPSTAKPSTAPPSNGEGATPGGQHKARGAGSHAGD